MICKSEIRDPRSRIRSDWERPVREAVGTIAEDKCSGAAELVLSAIDRWLRLMEVIPGKDLPEATRSWVKGLIEAQPSMAPFYHMGARVLEEGARVAWERGPFADRCNGLREDLRAMPQRVAEVAMPLLLDARVIVTYSRSSTVIRALERIAERRHSPKVILSEGRPMLEGVDVARKLLELGLPVRLTVDAALSAQLVEANLVVVGGDSLGPKGLVNKVGTRALAAMARDEGVPIYALCGSDKWVPAAWESQIRIQDHDPGEVLQDPPEGLEISNRYFDLTPLEWLTVVVNERAILSPQEARSYLESLDSISLTRDA